MGLVCRWLALLALVAGPAGLRAGPPVLRNLNVRGLQVGGTTTLTIDGDDLGAAPRLLLPFAADQKLQPNHTDKQATFAVTLADVTPGYYPLRLVTDGGVGQPVAVAVDRLPQRPLTATVEQLPVALHGSVGGAAVVETRFAGRAGQKVTVEVEAQRLGGKLRPVVHLYGPKRLQTAWAWPTPALSGDARLEATLPENGTYTVALHDLEYAAPAPGFFRLRVGQWSFADQVFPPAVGRGQGGEVELLGPTTARVDLQAAEGTGALPLPWPKDGLWSGPRPFVRVSPHAEVVGRPAPGKAQDLPAGPVGVSGRLLEPNGEDRYRVAVTPRTKVRLEVFAERIGSPLDAALVVRNEQGADLARVEDGPGTVDPVMEFAVPDNVTAVVVAVVDSQGRGGPHAVYRLVVEPQGQKAKAALPLFTPASAVALPVGGRAVVPVLIDRTAYEGSVELSAEGLPAGVTLEGNTIPEGADGALVTVVRGEGGGDAAITHWRGRGADGVTGTVAVKGHPLERAQPWFATELALAPTAANAADLQIDWRGLPDDAGLIPARKLALPVKLTRPADGPVRLTLLTSQARPLVNGALDPNQALRLEKPVELAAKTTDGELTLLVPPQPPATAYDLTVQAELLTPDKQKVRAVAFAPVRRLAVRDLLAVSLDGAARVEVLLDAKTGATVKVQGKIERREGLTGDVALTLTGLPPGASAAPVTVKAADAAFVLTVVLPVNTTAGEIGGLKLSATAAADAKQPNVRVRSRDVELTLVAKAAGK
jgi:hypothetical protein